MATLSGSCLQKVKGQDDEDEDEDEDNYEEESSAVKAKEESGRLTDAPAETTTRTSLSLAQVNNLTKLLSQRQDLGNGTNGNMNQALMSMILLAALSNNANSNQAAATVAAVTAAPVTTAVPEVETEEPSSTTREEYVVGQVGKILDSVMRANISGIVDNAVRIGAPPSVITMMGNIMTALNSWTGGVFGLRIETTPQPAVNCGGPPTSAPRPRQPQVAQVPRPRPRPPISPAASGGTLITRTG